MIVPMKKIFVLLLESEKSDALKVLRNMGVAHLENITGSGDQFDELSARRDIVQRSIQILPEQKGTKLAGSIKSDTEMEIAKRILDCNDRSKQLEEEIGSIKKELDRLELWGDFDPADVKALDKKDIHLRLYELTKEQKASLPDSVQLYPVKEKKYITYAVIIIPNGIELPELQEVSLPEKSISELNNALVEKQNEKKAVDSELDTFSGSLPGLNVLLQELNEKIEFESVRSSLNIEEQVAYVSGFIPADTVEKVKTTAKENGWGILVREPSFEDTVPTLVKNNRVVKIIQPVFDLFGIIPGYYERDISFFFLIFLSIFVAMIVGDGGYGVIFLILALYSGFSARKKSGIFPDFSILLIVMSLLTIFWGAITNTWFGSGAIAGLPFFKMLTIDKLANFSTTDTSTIIMYICFILGVTHIGSARIWNFLDEIKNGRVLKSFAQFGWLSIVIGLYFYVLNFVLDPTKYPIPQFALYMIIGGISLVILFSEQEGNFFKGILRGFSNIITIFFGAVGAFADIISYIRLFAVGLATLAVASSFNGMAASAGNGVVGIIGGVLILLLGHGLNIAMSTLAIVVHGVRLNVLEFSGHLGMEWSGVNYNPFRNRKIKE